MEKLMLPLVYAAVLTPLLPACLKKALNAWANPLKK